MDCIWCTYALGKAVVCVFIPLCTYHALYVVTYRELVVTAQNRKCRVIALLSRAKALALTGHGDSEIAGPGWPWPRQMQTLQCSSISHKRGGAGVWTRSEIPDSTVVHQSQTVQNIQIYSRLVFFRCRGIYTLRVKVTLNVKQNVLLGLDEHSKSLSCCLWMCNKQ